jgi:hypothetical protein
MVDDHLSNQAKQFCDDDSTAELQTKQSNEKLNTLDLADELHRIASRVLGLELAIIGASKECQMNAYGEALAQLAQDIALDLEALERKYRDQQRDEAP